MGFNSAFKGLNAELNPICHLLALLGAHHILHVNRIRVNQFKSRPNTDTRDRHGEIATSVSIRLSALPMVIFE